MRRIFRVQFAMAALLAASSSAWAQTMIAPDAVRWGPPPAAAMVGTPPDEFLKQPPFQVAVLSGDPLKAGSVYSIRFKCPDGLRVAPHWHPTVEHLTILQGTFGLGHGDTWDQTKGQELSAGSYARVAANMHHFAWCKGETIVQAYGIGPFKIYWLNPAAKKPTKSKRRLRTAA